MILEDGCNFVALVQVVERMLQHAFRGKKLWLRNISVDDPWPFIQGTLQAAPESVTGPGTHTLLATVADLTEQAPEMRTQKYITMSLMRQTLSMHIRALTLARDIDQWFEPWAMLRTPDRINPIITLLKGLSELEFNFRMKEDKQSSRLRKRQSVSQILLNCSEGMIKSSLSATWSTLGRVQTRAESRSIEAIPEAAQSDASHRMGNRTPISSVTADLPAPLSPPKSAELIAAEESIEKLIADQHDITQKLDELQETLAAERRVRMALESELVNIKTSRDKEIIRLRKEVNRLENQLSVYRMSPMGMHEELIQSLDELDALREQLQRAKLATRLSKEHLKGGGIVMPPASAHVRCHK
eukprot:jgi/Hompol1/6808/HPOL_002294-RA